jgi:NADPH:quinone reductase-like Zn-dependent oxidoreductase
LFQHVEVPVPTPKKDELLLKLEATSLNPLDWKIQKGVMRPFAPRKFPYIPGNSLQAIEDVSFSHISSTMGDWPLV